MSRAVVVVLPVLLLCLFTLSPVHCCPRSCNCYQASEVHCTFRSLQRVPPGLPPHTRRINLGFNNINSLVNGSFSGLKNVELLMLHSNNLQQVPAGVFRDMKSLQILKLSYNKLEELWSPHTFSGLTSVLRLYLDHNLLRWVHPRAFLQTPRLRLLRLQGNRLLQLHPQALSTLSLLNTYYYSTVRHLDLSNNSLSSLPSELLETAPLLETLALHANPWSCECGMEWLLSWTVAHPGVMKCPGGPQCPVCASPVSLQGQGLLDQPSLPCSPPLISSPGRNPPLELPDLPDNRQRQSFAEPFGAVSLTLSDQQGFSVDVNCNITESETPPDVASELSTFPSSAPLSLALALSLECYAETQGYEKLWRIMAYYSETAARLERELMLSKAPNLAYRYRQADETEGYYHTGVKASVRASPQWLLQPAISIQLNRAKSSRKAIHLVLSTRVSAHSDQAAQPSASRPWVLISANRTVTGLSGLVGSSVELSCPILSSGEHKVEWVFPDGAKVVSSSGSSNGRWKVLPSGLAFEKLELSDAGLYYCKASSGRDTDVLPLQLVVIESFPSTARGQVEMNGIIGQQVSLSCNASGSPLPSTSWLLPNGKLLWEYSVLSDGVAIEANGSLTLPRPSLRDAGHYSCIVVNQHGSDSLSTRLELKPRQTPPLKTAFPRRPQSAAGRSTKIRAPLLRLDEGSGDGEEEEENSLRNRRPFLNRQNNQRRRGPGRNNAERGNRVGSRHRVTGRQRIDPKKWADLLAKIREKAIAGNNSQPAEPTEKSTEKGGQDEESSSGDGTNLQEESLQPVYPDNTPTESLTNDKTDQNSQSPSVSEDTANSFTTPGHEAQETQSTTHLSTTAEMIQAIMTTTASTSRQDATTTPRARSTQKAVERNEKPSSRPMSPWNTRRRIGQRRRFFNRTRARLLTTSTTMSVKPFSPTTTAPTHLKRTSPSSKMSSPVPTPSLSSMSTTRKMIHSTPARRVLDTRTPTAPGGRSADNRAASEHAEDTGRDLSGSPLPPGVSISFPSSSSSAAPSAKITARTPPGMRAESLAGSGTSGSQAVSTDALLDVALISPVTTKAALAESEIFIPSATVQKPILSTVYIAPTATTTAATALDTSSEIEVTPSTVNPSSTTTSASLSATTATTLLPISTSTSTTSTTALPTSTTTTTAATTPATTTTSTSSPPVTTTPTTTAFTNKVYISKTKTTTTTTPTTALSSTTRTTALATSTTTTPVTTTTSTSPPTTTPATTTTSTSSSTSAPATTTTSTPSTTTVRNKIFVDKARATSVSARTATGEVISTQTSKEKLTSATSTTTTTLSTRDRPRIPSVDPRQRAVPGTPGQVRPHTDWRKPGSANAIPDSQSSRTLQPAPRIPVSRSRPRISDPHIRTLSLPAESTAWLHCEAQGEPKPTITWTKVATGAVMSAHSRAQRLEVLPNGTLVIQSVQLQDRGSYICSASSFMGRDRLLTTLDVWTRAPRMQLPAYRELTTHQGGNLSAACQAQGTPTPLLSWVLPDRSVLTPSSTSPNTRVTMSQNGTLHLTAAVPSDRGVYRCVASNSAGAASASVRIHVSSLPPVIQQPKEETIALSMEMPVYVHCSARGAPTPALRWKIPSGIYVRPSQFLHGNLFVLPNGTLHIRSLGTKDAGSYECTASNAVGADKRVVRIEIGGKATDGVAGRIRITAHKDSLQSNTELSNSAKVFPAFPIERPRTAPQPTSAPKVNAPVTVSSNLLPGIDGRMSSAVEKSRKAEVFPGVSPEVRPTSPFSKARIVSTSPSITTATLGELLQLHCDATGHPPPNIVWRTPSRKLVDLHFSFDRRLKVHLNGTLSVWGVTEKDGGDYLCIARNKVSDDYRLVRVSVVPKPSVRHVPQPASLPATIQHKQPVNHMVSLGKPLQVDCLASGRPDPSVRWSLPDGTVVNRALPGEDKAGRARRLTVFDNGTLLVPAVGRAEEGEYTCHAENQAGRDTMKVKVKVMSSPPVLTDDAAYRVLKVQLGTTAKLLCQATGDPAPSVTWLSPMNRVIPWTSGSGFYTERVVVVSGGTLEVRLAQKQDTGNYTCRASNSAGTRARVVRLEVEVPNAIRNTVSSNVLNGPAAGITTQLGRSVVSVGVSGASNVGFRTDGSGIHRNNIGANRESVDLNGEANRHNVVLNGEANRQSTISNRDVNRQGVVFNGDANRQHVALNREANRQSVVLNRDANRQNGQNPVLNVDANSNEVVVGKPGNDANMRSGFSSGLSHFGTDESVKNTVASNRSSGVVLTVKQQVTKGQSVFLHCPAIGSPSSRLTWLLPGNAALNAPYRGSRLTVHRNGTLEIREVSRADRGRLVCVVRGDRGETRLQVELDIAEGPPNGAQHSQSLSNARNLDHYRIQIAPKPAPRSTSSLPGPSSRIVQSEKVLSTRTAGLVSIINGETLRLPCSAPHSARHSHETLFWTLPNGKRLGRDERQGVHSVESDGTLTVQQASVYDRGTYTCRFGAPDSSGVFEITIPVIVIAYPPRITSGPAPVTYTRPGAAVELPCLAIATPRATITWEMPDMSQLSALGQARVYGNRYLSPQGSLVIQNPSSRDTGFYRCTAKNVIGADSKSTYLHVI